MLDVIKSELTNFLWEGGRPIEEFALTPGKKEKTAQGRRYVWGMGGMLEQQDAQFNARVPAAPSEFLLGEAGVRGGERLHGHTDELRSVRLLTDLRGRQAEQSSWGAWGDPLMDGVRTRFGFGGYQTERASGLRYSVARYLDPRSGRWTQRDPLEDVDGPNRYLYVRGCPTTLTDPEGRSIAFILAAGLSSIPAIMALYYMNSQVFNNELYAGPPSGCSESKSSCKEMNDRITRIDEVLAELRAGRSPSGRAIYSTLVWPNPRLGPIPVTFRKTDTSNIDKCVNHCMLQHELAHHAQIVTLLEQNGHEFFKTFRAANSRLREFEIQAYEYEKACLQGLLKP